MSRLSLGLGLAVALAGCHGEPPPPPVPPEAPASAAPPAPRALADSQARGPDGKPVAPDAFRALAAQADTSLSRSTGLIGRAGVFHGGEVDAQTGEVWQGLYPTASGFELRPVPLRVEPARDEVADGLDGPVTGVRVATPSSTPTDGFGAPEDAALALVRRPGRPFAAGPVSTAFAGSWPARSGRRTLVLGTERAELSVVEGPDVLASPHERVRPERVLVLTHGDGRRQPLVHIIDRDGGRPALVWAGDLDGDARLDLLLDESWDQNVTAPTLYLSSEAEAGRLVRRVARHETVGS